MSEEDEVKAIGSYVSGLAKGIDLRTTGLEDEIKKLAKQVDTLEQQFKGVDIAISGIIMALSAKDDEFADKFKEVLVREAKDVGIDISNEDFEIATRHLRTTRRH